MYHISNDKRAVLKHKIFRAARFSSISDKTEIEKGNWMLYNLIDRLEKTNQLSMRVETLNLWLKSEAPLRRLSNMREVIYYDTDYIEN